MRSNDILPHWEDLYLGLGYYEVTPECKITNRVTMHIDRNTNGDLIDLITI